MSFIIELTTCVLLIIGASFMLIGSIGLAKLPDFFTRLHAPTKASTLGVGCVLFSSICYFSFQEGELRIIEILISLFLLITAPVSAHMLAKAGLHYRESLDKRTHNAHLAQRAYDHQAPSDELDK